MSHDKTLMALVENEASEKPPVNMRSMGDDGLIWSLDMAHPDPERHRLHLVASWTKALSSALLTLRKQEKTRVR